MTAFASNLEAVLKREFPDCEALLSCDRLSGGANQETYCVVIERAGERRQLAFRRAAGGGEENQGPENIGLDNEAKLMSIAQQHDIPTPAIYYRLKPEDNLGFGFFMEWIDGETRGSKIVSDARYANLRETLAYECGVALAKIHGIDVRKHRLDELLPVRSPEDNVMATWRRYQQLKTPHPMIDYTAKWLLNHLPKENRITLVHSDFRNGNLLVNEDRLAAVLDWEIAQIGDPIRDLGWLCTGSWRFGAYDKVVGGFGELADLLDGYSAASGVSVSADHLRFWQVYGSFWWAVGCLYMADHYRHGPDPSVERPAIGRRSSECQIDCVNLLIPGIAKSRDNKNVEKTELPEIDELLQSVCDYLLDDVSKQTTGRTRYLARVASNSLEIARRDRQYGQQFQQEELHRLQRLLKSGAGDLTQLRWQLIHQLRDGDIALDEDELTRHLRQTTVDQVMIDQPSYSGLRNLTGGAH